jgi:hypothetical protein
MKYPIGSFWSMFASKWPESIQLGLPLIAKTQRLKQYLLDSVIKNVNQVK